MVITTKSFRKRGWLKLDNAAKLFPAITNSELTSVFRISANLKKPVNYTAIKEAVRLTSERFPYFSVSLGSGIFWHYLEYYGQVPRLQAEEKVPCTAFAVGRTGEPLYRVLVNGTRISVEFIHILTDGSGALEYLKSLLYTYLRLSGALLSSSEGIIIPGTEIQEEEIVDAYNKFFSKQPAPDKIAKSWHLPFKLNDRPRLKVLRAEAVTGQVLETARSKKATITEYFVAVYLYSLQEIYTRENEKGNRQKSTILRVEVPINMRNLFPIRTIRNFSLFIMPQIDLKNRIYTFDEVLDSVRTQLRTGSDIDQITRFLSSNVGHEKQLLIRILPLFVKRIAIAAIYRGLGSKRTSGIITNLGVVRLPPDMQDYFDSFELLPPPPNKKVKVTCSIISFKDKLMISFCNITDSNEVERHIFKYLSDAGIHIKILNNT